MEWEITSLPERFLTEVRRKTFGFVFQQFNLIKGITVLENVMIPAYPMGGSYASLRGGPWHCLRSSTFRTRPLQGWSGFPAGKPRGRRLPGLIERPISDHRGRTYGESRLQALSGFSDPRETERRGQETVFCSSHNPLVFNSDVVERVICLRDGRIDGNGSHDGFPSCHPVALHISSILIGSIVLSSYRHGIQILRRWDLKSGSELQLTLERKTYLVSTLLAYAFAFQLGSLFLFIYTADHLHPLFVGAMCAAGSLFVNPFGYPTLLLKTATFILLSKSVAPPSMLRTIGLTTIP